MRLYMGYPDSFCGKERFRLKDNFFREIGIDYTEVSIEVKRKALSILDNVCKRNYIYIDNIFYDVSDILEFALFSISGLPVNEVVVPGYLYGKSVLVLKEVLKAVFGENVPVYYDFNLFPTNTLVVNVGYRTTSVSFGGKFLATIPLGEYHLVDSLGNYLFNRFILESGLSNANLRKQGIRGELLDRFRGLAGKILFKGETKVHIEEFNYEREVLKDEVDLVLSINLGVSNYGDFIKSPTDFSSSLILSLYRFETAFKERPRVDSAVIIGRLFNPFRKVLQRVFPIPLKVFSGRELLSLPVISTKKVKHFKIKFFSEHCFETIVNLKKISCEPSVKNLRKFFNNRDIVGLDLIEKMAERGVEDVQFANELLSIVRRSTHRTDIDILFLSYAISALSMLNFPESILNKVVDVMIEKAFDWRFPFSTKMNILYFLFKNSGRIKNEKLQIFLPLLLTYVRDKTVSDGEKNFMKTVIESFYGSQEVHPVNS